MSIIHSCRARSLRSDLVRFHITSFGVLRDLIHDLIPDLIMDLIPDLIRDFIPNLIHDLIPDLIRDLIRGLIPDLTPDLILNRFHYVVSLLDSLERFSDILIIIFSRARPLLESFTFESANRTDISI